jgi:NADH:ubiquinone oxidoreductase subunit 2 (subunit N)
MFQLYRRRTAEVDSPDISPVGAQVLVIALALVVLALGIFPEPLLGMTQRAADALPAVSLP